MITRTDILAHLTRGVRVGFTVGMKGYTSLIESFCGSKTSDGAYENYTDMGSIPWPVQNAGKPGAAGTASEIGDAPKVGRMDSGEVVQVVGGEERAVQVYNLDYEIVVALTHNAIDDNRAGDLESWAKSAGLRFAMHEDYLAFDALNNGAATTSYGACYDNYALFSGSHADPGAEYTTAQDNQYTSSLTLDNFETVKVAGAKFLDSRGQPMGFSHRLLIVPPDYEREGYQITGNPNAYDTADREINPYSGTTRMIVAPGAWLDSTSWFLADDGWGDAKPLYMQKRKDPQLAEWDDERAGDGGVRYYKFHARRSVFPGDWRLILQGNT